MNINSEPLCTESAADIHSQFLTSGAIPAQSIGPLTHASASFAPPLKPLAQTNATSASPLEPAALSNKELYEKCRLYGAETRKWSKKFAALLPEVARRELYKKHGFYSIFEFAAKLAGMNRETVIEILRVARRLEDKPILMAQLEEQGWSKMKVIANIATKENEKILAEKVKTMSKATLETFVNELKKQNDKFVRNRPGTAEKPHALAISQIELAMQEGAIIGTAGGTERQISATAPPRISVRMPLKPQTELRLRELQKKLSKQAGGPIDFNEVMETLLDTYERAGRAGQQRTLHPLATPSAASDQTAQKNSARLKKDKPDSQDGQAAQKTLEKEIQKELNEKSELEQYGIPASRHIPAKIRRVLHQKFIGRCAYPGCIKLPDINHHTRRFALNPSHDPDFIAPLCKAHERLAHHGLIENEESQPENWRVKISADKAALKYAIDKRVNEFRQSQPL